MVEAMIPPPSAPVPPPAAPRSRKKLFLLFFVIVAVAGLAWFGYWWIWGRFYEYTDDAYVTGNMVTLTPQVPGIVISINTDETYLVEKEQLIIQLDTTDLLLAFEQKKAELGETLRRTIGMFERVAELRAEVQKKDALFFRTSLDYDHRRQLVVSGSVSLEDFEHAEAALFASYAALQKSEHALTHAFAQVENSRVLTHPRVQKAMDKLRDAYVQLQRCQIKAPVTGIVAQRNAQVGEHVNPGTPLLAIIPLDEIWVYANFKEVQLGKMKIGQPVHMKADIYGGSVPYHGKVVGIAGGTGSVFSVIPPQNATGNWIKIVQRLPIKISLDPEEIKKNPLRLGLSMDVTVDLHDTEGSSIPPLYSAAPVYETDIFAKQLDGVEEVIDEIVQTNVDPRFLLEDYYIAIFDGN